MQTSENITSNEQINGRPKSVVAAIGADLEKIAAENGVWLYDLEYVKEAGTRILRLYIDKENGVDLNDCERVSKAAGIFLDERDPISESYTLEVSSPGIERRLRKDSHFARYAGERVTLRLFAPYEGKKSLTGILIKTDENNIYITDENGREHSIERKMVSVCKLSVFN